MGERRRRFSSCRGLFVPEPFERRFARPPFFEEEDEDDVAAAVALLPIPLLPSRVREDDLPSPVAREANSDAAAAQTALALSRSTTVGFAGGPSTSFVDVSLAGASAKK